MKFCKDCNYFLHPQGIPVPPKCKHEQATRVNPVWGNNNYQDAPGFRAVVCKGKFFEEKVAEPKKVWYTRIFGSN